MPRRRARDEAAEVLHGQLQRPLGARKETNGVSANGVAANFIFVDGGTFGVSICQICQSVTTVRTFSPI